MASFSATGAVISPDGLIIGPKDDRQTLAEYVGSHKQSEEQVRNQFVASGRLTCNGRSASAQITFRNNIITTVAHVFFSGCNQQVNLSSCTFSTVFEYVPRAFRIQRIVETGVTCPTPATANSDWAVVELAESTGIQPYNVYGPNVMANLDHFTNQKTTHVAGWHADRCTSKYCPPLISECLIRDIINGQTPTPLLHTDCDAGGAASGSAQLVMQNDGTFVVLSLQVAKADTASYQPYNRDHVFMEAIPLQGRFLEVLLQQ